MNIIQERLEKLPSLTLFSGSHKPGSQMCALEVAAWLIGDEWTDHPECVCPVLGAFMRSWNDGLPDDERGILLPFIPRLINTRGSKQLEKQRAMMAADWLIRKHTVAWLRLAKLDAQADALASLPEITDFAQCPSLMPTLTAVRTDAAAAWAAAWGAARGAATDAAWDAAWAAARDVAWAAARAAAMDAAWDTAWGAARGAAWDAAWAAARDAAWDTAWGAARGAAWDAAWAAARDTAWAATKQMKVDLQRSAVDLVERMINLTDAAP